MSYKIPAKNSFQYTYFNIHPISVFSSSFKILVTTPFHPLNVRVLHCYKRISVANAIIIDVGNSYRVLLHLAFKDMACQTNGLSTRNGRAGEILGLSQRTCSVRDTQHKHPHTVSKVAAVVCC